MVASLHSLMTTLGDREEIWSVGRMAKQVGEQLRDGDKQGQGGRQLLTK